MGGFYLNILLLSLALFLLRLYMVTPRVDSGSNRARSEVVGVGEHVGCCGFGVDFQETKPEFIAKEAWEHTAEQAPGEQLIGYKYPYTVRGNTVVSIYLSEAWVIIGCRLP